MQCALNRLEFVLFSVSNKMSYPASPPGTDDEPYTAADVSGIASPSVTDGESFAAADLSGPTSPPEGEEEAFVSAELTGPASPSEPDDHVAHMTGPTSPSEADLEQSGAVEPTTPNSPPEAHDEPSHTFETATPASPPDADDEAFAADDAVGPASPAEADDEAAAAPEEAEGTGAHVGELMANIFGDSDEEEVERDDEVRVIGIQHEEGDEEEGDGKEWDFDRIMEEKKRERSRKRKRRKDGSIDLCSSGDGQIRHIVEMMKTAAAEDRDSNQARQPAIQKTKLLEIVRTILLRADYFEYLIENDMMSAISEWLAPLPDKSLPALEIRSTLLRILTDFPHIEPGVLKQSGLGKAVMLVYKHPKETRENKLLASKLIRNWSQPIFQVSSDYSVMSKDERQDMDLERLPDAKRRKLIESERRGPRVTEPIDVNEIGLKPGDPGYINRARVPKASTSAYVIRPKSTIEGNFRGASKNRQNDRFDRTQREFKERTKTNKASRAYGVSLEGRKMD